MPEIIHEFYLGDGVYAIFTGYDVKLYTLEGNEIYLEFELLERLKSEYDRLKDQYSEETT